MLVEHPERFWSRVERSSGCWAWKGHRNRKGYGRFTMSVAKDGRKQWMSFSAHRMAWNLTKGDAGELHVLHKCDNPSCCNPDHLFLGTNSDNIRDREAKGRGVRLRGERHWAARLSEDDVLDIRAVHAFGGQPGDLAKAYGVSIGCIKAILGTSSIKKTWTHLP